MIFIPVLALVFLLIIKDWKQTNKDSEAIALDFDMACKFRELLDDPFMDDQKWNEWLPVFEFADEVIKRKTNLPLCNHARLIRTMFVHEENAGSED